MRCPECQGLSLVPAASAFPNMTIYIKREFWEPGTAASMALLGHELCHLAQFRSLGEGVRAFEIWDRMVEKGVLQPWEHPLEAPCYRLEAHIYRTLVAEGWPPGRFKPLFVLLNGERG